MEDVVDIMQPELRDYAEESEIPKLCGYACVQGNVAIERFRGGVYVGAVTVDEDGICSLGD